MSLISFAIQNALKADTVIKAIVNNRVYPDVLPRVNDADPALPALSVSVVSDPPVSNSKCQRTARIQVSCWSNPPNVNGVKSPLEVETLHEAVITALHHDENEKFTTVYTVSSKHYHVIGQRCINSIRLREQDTDFYHIACDFEIIYRKLED
jgi:hypothetical protein